MACKAIGRFFIAAIATFVLFSGCGGSGLKSRQTDGGLGGSGGVHGSGGSGVGGTSASGGSSEHGGASSSGGSGAGGTSASGGSSEHGGAGGSGGSGGAKPDAGCPPGWTLCCGQCLGPSAGVCAPCPVGGTSGSGGGMDGGMAGSGGGSGGTTARDAGIADARQDSSAVDVLADARQDSSAVDVATAVDTMPSFIDQIDGIWLVGWMGDMNHFSWVRIGVVSRGLGAGSADFLAGDDLTINSPYWQCSGQGRFVASEKPNSILFTFPASCPSGIEREYTFDPFQSPGSYPKGAILAATVTPLSGVSALQGYKFPDTQCNADMTSCSDPL